MSENTITVTNDADYRTALAAGYKPESIKIGAPDNSAAIESARSDGHAAGKAEGITEGRGTGILAERARINGIHELFVRGFETERDAAIKDGTAVADFAIVQAKAIKDRGITVDGIQNDSKGAPHSPPNNDPAAKGSWDTVVARHKSKVKAA